MGVNPHVRRRLVTMDADRLIRRAERLSQILAFIGLVLITVAAIAAVLLLR